MPAQQIYPGVYVPTSSAKPSSRGYKYLSFYSDVRFQNWQTSLEVATAQYKLSMDAYKAELRAIQDTITSAQKSVDSIQSDIDRIRSEFLTVAEKEQATNVAATNSTNRFNTGQANSSARTEYSADQAAKRTDVYVNNRPSLVFTDSTIQDAMGLTDKKYPSSSPSDPGIEAQRFKEYDQYLRDHPNKGFVPTAGDMAKAYKLYFDNEIAKAAKGWDPKKPADRQAFLDSKKGRYDTETMEAFGQAYDVSNSPASDLAAAAGGPATSYTGTKLVNYDETQKARLRELYKLGGFDALATIVPPGTKPEDILKALGISASDSKMKEAQAALAKAKATTTERPSSDIIGTAQDIYAQRYERLPGYKRQEAYQEQASTIDTVMQRFAEKRLSLLPATATDAEARLALREAYADAAIWLTNPSYVPTWLKDSRSPAKPSEPTAGTDTKGTSTEPLGEAPAASGAASGTLPPLRSVRLPGDDEYEYAYDEANDEYIVSYGPDNIGARFGRGTAAYKKLHTEGILGDPLQGLPPVDISILGDIDDPYTYQYDRNRGVFIIASGPDNVGKEYGRGTKAAKKLTEEGVPGKMKAPKVEEVPPPKPTVMDIIAGKTPKAAPLEDKPDEPTKPSKPVDTFTLSGLPQFGALMATLPTREKPKETKPVPPSPYMEDNKRKVESLIAGGELATKPRKVERLLATSWGKSVDELYTANSKATNPLGFAELRDQLLVAYRDYPKQAERMVQLLAAKYVIDNKPAGQQ